MDLKTISQLRDQTGAGIGDCKKALEEAGGDINGAIEVLRKQGEVKAAKKSDRTASEGVVAFTQEGDKLAVVVLNCETDFVARNEDFVKTAEDFAKKLLAEGEESFKTWAEETIKNELVVKIGENIQLGQFAVISGGTIGSYLHANKKLASTVVLEGGSEELANDIAMHISAMSPEYLSPEDVPAEILEKEKEIYKEQLKQEGKPEQIWDKIIEGKLAKYYEGVCLLNQDFIKDEDKKISELLGDAKITSFDRYAV